MKKRFALLLLAALALGATSAHAATMKATGSWQIDAMNTSEMDFDKAGKDNGFSIGQRMRTKFEFIANENLKGVLETQIGTNSWGRGLYGVGAGRTPTAAATATGSLSAGNGNIMMRKGYLDFKWPGTKVNFLVGYQSLALPAAFGTGSAILDDHVAGAAAVVPVTDTIALVGGFARAIDSNNFGSTSTANRSGTSADVAFMYANIDSITGVKIQPFMAYSYAGKSAVAAGYNPNGDGSLTGFVSTATGATNVDGIRGYFGGAAVTVTALDPFKIMGDVNYGVSNYNGGALAGSSNGWNKNSRAGWLFDLAVDYTGLSMMTPEVFGVYTTGTDASKQRDGRMPVISAENWTYGSFFMQTSDGLLATVAGQTDSDSKRNMGFWALGASLKDIKLIDKLSHTVNLVYFKGTNNINILGSQSAGIANGSVAYGKTLTTKDSLWEVDLNSKYQIYEELTLGLELGYINADFDKNAWATALGRGATSGDLSKDAYKAAMYLNYSF